MTDEQLGCDPPPLRLPCARGKCREHSPIGFIEGSRYVGDWSAIDRRTVKPAVKPGRKPMVKPGASGKTVKPGKTVQPGARGTQPAPRPAPGARPAPRGAAK